MLEMFESVRQLKAALRRTLRTWDVLHGEVDFDELLLVSALLEACPSAVNFLRHVARIAREGEIHELRFTLPVIKEERRKELIREHWDRDVGDPTLQAGFARSLVGVILPEVKDALETEGYLSWGGPGLQSLNKVGRTDYLDRILRAYP
jgi:hypothetical protein